MLWLLIPLISCSLMRSGSQDPKFPQFISDDSVIAIRDVNIISVDHDGVESNRTVIISEGKIQEIYAAEEAVIPESAEVIEGEGKYLMPGLLDMHTHVLSEDVPKYIKHGITTVRHMWGTPNVKALISQIEEDDIVGPAIFSTSPGIDGRPPSWPGTQIIEDPAEAPALIKKLKDEGWPFLKVYNRLSPEVYEAIADAAHAENIRFLGHSPFAIPIGDVLAAGQASVEHLTGYDRHLGGSQGFRAWTSIDKTKIPALAEMTSEKETWNCPTLVVLDALTINNLGENSSEVPEQNRFKLVKAFYDQGAKLLIGTDAGVQLVDPGVSLHNEVKKFVEAGIPPLEVIRIATVEGARFLGIEDQIGTVTAGKQADLILLNKNPLEKIEHISSIEGVILDGAWYTPSYFDK